MNLDELQSVQARERQSSDLQHLRSSFYQEVGEYVQELTEKRAEAVERSEDPFSSPEVRQLSDDIETAEQTVEAIYERRVGKVVKKASIAAAGMPVDDDGLTAEEEALFDDLVDRIEENRTTVLSVLDGESASVSRSDVTGGDDGSDTTSEPGPSSPEGGSSTPDSDGADPDDQPGDSGGSEPVGGADSEPVGEADPEPVDAADLMGGGGDARSTDDSEGGSPDATGTGAGPREVPPEPAPPGEVEADDGSEASTRTESSSSAEGGERPDDDVDSSGDARDDEESGGGEERDGGSDGTVPGLPRTTVRITTDVGEVVGADNRDYDLSEEDVVTLPEPNADVLVEKDAAERLE